MNEPPSGANFAKIECMERYSGESIPNANWLFGFGFGSLLSATSSDAVLSGIAKVANLSNSGIFFPNKLDATEGGVAKITIEASTLVPSLRVILLAELSNSTETTFLFETIFAP